MRFNKPIFILPILSLLPNIELNSLATSADICCWTYGMFNNKIVPIYSPNTIPSTQRTVFFSVLIGD